MTENQTALENILTQYKQGLITELQKNEAIFDLLYRILYPEQFV